MRYIIGIDLGTTNSSLSYIDTEGKTLGVQPFLIPQFSDVGTMQQSDCLPSFCYLTKEDEFPKNAFCLPWQKKEEDIVVGLFAKKLGMKKPLQLVQSAKSWLCHLAASQRDPILPPLDAENIRKISPVEATRLYLKSLKDAWNHKMGKGNPEFEFENQEIILTVPASFDEVARMLTVEAAKQAGFLSMTLLEEPQSAFYSFMENYKGNFEEKFKDGDSILVVDIGGGTTDFSLIEAKKSKEGITFQRKAVGDHLLLGGDNMDAFVAGLLESKVKRPNKEQRFEFYRAAREAKEKLLSSDDLSYTCMLQSRSSKIVEESVFITITKKELQERLLEGFFPFCPFEETKHLKKRAGIQTFGLAFEDEPSIIKQLGHFLHLTKVKSPDYILFNGGACKPKIFQDAIKGAINKWFPEKEIEVLTSVSLDLAVCRGAAYYGKARRGLGFKISGGSSKGYYLKVETQEKKEMAICLLAKGAEEGFVFKREEPFFALPNTAVLFQLYASNVRLSDKAGDLIEIEEEEMLKLPPIQTLLHFGKKEFSKLIENRIPVHLSITLTPIGTLEISLCSAISTHQWSLEFQLKNAAKQEDAALLVGKGRNDETFEAKDLILAKEAIGQAFSKDGKIPQEKLMEHLEILLERPRQDFPASVLRSFFDALITCSDRRHLNKSRFFNLAGFFLRPGFGYPLDDFRMKNLWKIILSESKIPQNGDCYIQKLIFFRRIAGGLNKGQ
ncbi:MAG TPA: Hsp70 family protein, partial [Parachlamydiaceae bacterium]|nr:Hsp70 family protein [Parachlamydiaceae bacterium]